MENSDKDKHASLVHRDINYDGKKSFIPLGPEESNQEKVIIKLFVVMYFLAAIS